MIAVKMPQWVQLPPNLVPEKHTMGKSIYTTDYSSKRPGFQLHLQKARGFSGSRHHPPVPKVCHSELFLVFFHLLSSAMPTDFEFQNSRNTTTLNGFFVSFSAGYFAQLTACQVIYLVKRYCRVIISVSEISIVFIFRNPTERRCGQTKPAIT